MSANEMAESRTQGEESEAGATTIGTPLSPQYEVIPDPTYWGKQTILRKLPESLSDFGPTSGGVSLIGLAGASVVLAIASWTRDIIKVKMPPTKPFEGPYVLSLTTGQALPSLRPLQDVKTPLRTDYKVQESQPLWGGRLSLVPTEGSPANFGSVPGAVRLVRKSDPGQTRELTGVKWSENAISTTLPSHLDSFPGPYQLSLDTNQMDNVLSRSSFDVLTRAQMVQGALSALAASMGSLGAPGPVDPAVPLPVDPGSKLPLRILSGGRPLPATVELPNGEHVNYSVSIRWTVEDSAQRWKQVASSRDGGDFRFAPNLVAAPPSESEHRSVVVRAQATVSVEGLTATSPELRVSALVRALPVSLGAPDPVDPAVPIPIKPGDRLPLRLLSSGKHLGATITQVNFTVQMRWAVDDRPDHWRQVETAADAGQFMFAPNVVEASASGGADRSAVVRAQATVAFDGLTATSPELSVRTLVKALPVPTVLALFNHPDFALDRGPDDKPPCVLLVVPPGQPTDADDILAQISVVAGALTSLSSPFPRMPGLGELATSTATSTLLLRRVTDIHELSKANNNDTESDGPKVRVRPTNRIDRLASIVFYRQFSVWTYTAEDSLSSAILMGAPGKTVCLYNGQDCHAGEGACFLTVPDGTTTPQGFSRLLEGVTVEVGNLNGVPPSFSRPRTGSAPRFPTDHFNNRLSSLKVLDAPPWPSIPIPGRFGELSTDNGSDLIEFYVEPNGNPPDPQVVNFRLELGGSVTWKKVLNLPDGQGSSWDIVAEGAGAVGENSLWAHQVHHGQVLTFKKSGAAWTIWEVKKLGDLGILQGGQRVVFRWVRD